MRYMICAVLSAALFLGGCAAEGDDDSRLGLLLSALESPAKAPIDLGNLPEQGGPALAARSGTTPVVWYLSPTSGSSMSDLAPIVVLFSEEMDPSTLVLGGTMASQASVAWYPYQVPNQYLLISPNPKWTAGSGRTLTIDADDAQGDTLTTVSLSYTVVSDTTPPSLVSVTPADNSNIWDVTTIKFVFNEALNSAKAPVFGGTMASQVNGWSYGSTTVAGDTVVVDAKTVSVPGGRWTTGVGRTLNVKVEDPSGNSTTTSNYTYDISAIADGIVYVKTTGSDTNPGTKDSPLATIGAGLTKVHTLMGTGRVNIAAGTYTESVTMSRDNISIYGGYSASDWTVRDASVHTTTINSAAALQNAVYVNGSTNTIGTGTVVDGLNLSGYHGLNIYRASPTISNNTIGGNSSSLVSLSVSTYSSANINNNVINAPNHTGSTSVGISAVLSDATVTSSLVISSNTVNAGACAVTCGAQGIALSVGTNAAAAAFTVTGNTVNVTTGSEGTGLALYSHSGNATFTVSDNVIDAGASTDLTQGIDASGYATSPSFTITRNTIDGGTGKTAYGIDAEQGGTLTATRNRVFAESSGATGSNSYGIAAKMPTVTLVNNIIGGGEGTAFARTISLGNSTTADVLNNTILGPTGSATNNSVIVLSGADGRIENNIIMETAGGTYCLGTIDSTAPAFTIKNNVINGSCTYIVQDTGNGCGGGSQCSLAQLNALGTGFGGNVSNDPLFTDADGPDNDASTFADNVYTLSSSTPSAVYQGGLDLSSEFTTDFTGATRTVSWSIGAYEKD